ILAAAFTPAASPISGSAANLRCQAAQSRLNGKALAAAAGALGVGIVEHEAGGEIVLAPVHHRPDQVQDRRAVDVEGASGRLDLLVEALLLGHIIDRVGEAGAAAPGRRQLDAD